jgi:hypothetical protein
MLECYRFGLQLFFRHNLNMSYGQEVMSLQSRRRLNFKNFKTPNLGVFGQNDISVQASWPNTKNTIRGKVVASHKSGPW